MFATLQYINMHHSYAAIDGQPDQNPFPVTQITNGAGYHDRNGTEVVDTTRTSRDGSTFDASTAPVVPGSNTNNEKDDSSSTDPVPDPPHVFQESLKELAKDLVLKEQQIEYLVSVLPGIGTSENDQSERIAALEADLDAAREERDKELVERDAMMDDVHALAARCRRVH